MTYEVRKRPSCRICGNKSFIPVVSFENMPFTDELISFDRRGQEFLHDIEIHWCTSCKTVQNLSDVHVAEYYRDYQYTVSGSTFARRFMQRLAEEAFRRFDFREGDRVIEIGSGDGFQLKCFQDQGAKVLGFEPSEQLTSKAIEIGVPTIKTLFDCEGSGQIPADFLPAKAVLLTYTFDHLPDPKSFLELTRSVLDPQRGIALIEVHDFAKIVARREICLFEHEHSIYLTALSMERLLKRCGFRLLATDLLPDNERRGNSLLVAATPDTNTTFSSSFLPSPEDLALDKEETIVRFESEVSEGIQRLRNHIEKEKSLGHRVAGYGSGGRGVMTLAMAGITNQDIDYLCDQNSSFHGLYTPSSHIPIVSPQHILSNPVDELLVFSYGYMNEIKASLAGFLEQGGRITSMLDLL
jgi:hypothetical protein